MSETNLREDSYPLDTRVIKLSKSARQGFVGNSFLIRDDGDLDLSEHYRLQEFSHYMVEKSEEGTKTHFSSGNLLLYIINSRIRMSMIDIISKRESIEIVSKLENSVLESDPQFIESIREEFHKVFSTLAKAPKFHVILYYWFNRINPAHVPYNRVFHKGDEQLAQLAIELSLKLSRMDPILEFEGVSLLEFLRTPEKLFPESIQKQVEYMLIHWADILGQSNLQHLLLGLDILKEEHKLRGSGPGPAEIPEFNEQNLQQSSEIGYSQDQHWMPQLVLLAKNVHVWLSQLTEKYGSPITTLSDIPDQELDELTLRGFTGLWLVGIWERSTASQTIKRAMGSTDAMASAYSIYDYSVAKDLGGQESFDELKSRLLQRGIRLGADMVPNHTGISSKWVLEHPEWFISTPSKPFPSYSYESHNLSDSDKIEIILEDHYYDQTDAAVTFKRIDKETGEEIYIYHGNDGTSYPWNDTAQIDFLNPEAREAVIEAIVNVAKQFPIIRFDAAMVLAKQHIRRLWYPTPGEGGDIPSRSQYSLSDEDFTSLIPNEFWREVVDRVNSEAPDTLLLAEAFWLLEGYFVRTLGMHRVYNSAFLKMLKDEQNYEYRQTIKNVLEYDPGILKRFVNYLTTPDETPAVVELGTGDKYFGLATMMVTMPGLPMFGHGQFEGYSEKYGMEYSRAYYDEGEDLWLIERHEREIVPLIKKRYLFAESKNFYLYDFFSKDGDVNENVFCYSNRYNDEKGLIIYNNKFEGASGWLKRSVAFSEKRDDLTTRLRQIDLFEGLDLDNSLGYLIFTDAVTQLQYIRSKDELREDGLFVSLGAFQYHVFLDMYEVEGEDQLWDQIVADLGGQGTEDLQTLYETLREDQNTPLEPASTHKGDTRSELDKLRDRIIQLQEKLIQHEEQEEIIAHLTVQVELLDQKESEIKSLQTLLKERDATIQSLQDKLNSSLPENSHLVEENESLKKEIENLQDKLNTTSPAGDDLSTILLGKILARLETLPNGIYLRNLAMSLGISSNLCLEHVMVLVNDGKLSIQRKREDDHNPKVLLSSDRK